MASDAPQAGAIEIHYTRPPGRVTVFRQQLVARLDDCVVTLLRRAELSRPVQARGTTVLEAGAPVVWFTFPDVWHDIGRFHTTAGVFTGYYANVLTPVDFVTPSVWQTTDLFLDVWQDTRGTLLLDAEELAAAERTGAVTRELADRARAEADRLLASAAAGLWPPAACRYWTLERALAATAAGGGTPDGIRG